MEGGESEINLLVTSSPRIDGGQWGGDDVAYQLNRLGKAVAELSSATAVVVGVASARLDAKNTTAESGGEGGGGGVDEYELLNMKDELKNKLAPLQEAVSALEKKADGYDGVAVAHTAQLEEIEKLIGHINVRNDNMQGEIMARNEIEKMLGEQRESSVREFQVAMRRVDQLMDGQQELEGKMLNKDDVLSTQYLEKCLGELSNDFASSMQRDHSEVMRLLDEKAPMDTIGGIERKFSQRLMQMEAILMKGVKGLDERASLALMKKADILQLERLKDKLELFIASQASAQHNNAGHGAAAQIGEHCLTCANQVSSPPHGSPAKAVQMRNSKGFERGELPNMMPTGTWHNTFGGLNNENRLGASNNSRVATRRQDTVNRFGGSPRSAGRNSNRSSGGARPTSSGKYRTD
ncbi:hypothetical protein CYMTET_29328 [Cymbomonas tetramitiformis]|uniref:Uncharacterized protein n=1 Tax=Cymbomonas tetramitiformis TaxID=36881 RepID=A0AAE0KV18_9CHLO|nr:hypothetical protein CYMTET_29328 [Cymbomonas tetramitiformis]